jgi:hypothetical protein
LGEYELEVATVRIKASVTLTALHDPKMVNVKC